MPVVRRIRISILSEEELKELERRVMRAETLAKRGSLATEQISRRPGRKGKTLGPTGAIFGEGGEEEALPSALIKKRRKTLTDRKADADIASAIKAKDRTSAQAFTRNQAFKELKDKVSKLDQGLQTTQKDVGIALGAVNNPGQLIINAFKGNKGVAKAAVIATIVAVIIGLVLSKTQAFFGPGGAGRLLIRKAILDESNTIQELKLLLDIRSGKVIFSSDMRVRSGLNDSAIAEGLGPQSQRFNELNIGSGLLS